MGIDFEPIQRSPGSQLRISLCDSGDFRYLNFRLWYKRRDTDGYRCSGRGFTLPIEALVLDALIEIIRSCQDENLPSSPSETVPRDSNGEAIPDGLVKKAPMPPIKVLNPKLKRLIG